MGFIEIMRRLHIVKELYNNTTKDDMLGAFKAYIIFAFLLVSITSLGMWLAISKTTNNFW